MSEADESETETESEATESEATESNTETETKSESETESEAETESETESESERVPAAAPEDELYVAAERSEALRQALTAYEAGDFVRVRELAEPLLANEDKDIASAAGLLISKTQADPALIGIIGACLAFFVFIAWKYLS